MALATRAPSLLVDAQAINNALFLTLLTFRLVVFQSAVLAYARATALLALISDLIVWAKTGTPALLALVFQFPVAANAIASALLTLALHPPMFTNALPFALPALVLNPAMLANAATTAILALVSNTTMQTNTRTAAILAAILGFAVRARRLLRSDGACCLNRPQRQRNFGQSKPKSNSGKQNKKHLPSGAAPFSVGS